MPIYEYECPDNHKFELMRPLSQATASATCPRCHQEAKRALSRFASFSTNDEGEKVPVAGAPSCATCGAGSCDSCPI